MYQGLFCGTSEVTVDEKGRFALPARYRSAIKEDFDGECCITRSIADPCLWIYPRAEWDRLAAELSALPAMGDPLVRSVQRIVLGSAETCRIDGQGRFLLPQELRQQAGIERKAYLIGFNNKFELWADSRYDEQRQRDAEVIANAGQGFTSHRGLENLRF